MPKAKLTREEIVGRFNEFLDKAYRKELTEASNEGRPLVIEVQKIDQFNPDLSEMLLKKPDDFFDVCKESMEQIEVPNPVKIRFKGNEPMNIRDLRSRHIGKLICIEGIVRRSSEIRPEIIETMWLCPDCSHLFSVPRKANFIAEPKACPKCKNRQGFKEAGKKMIDTRWITVDEPFELTEGERPSQLNIFLTEDLVSPEGRRVTDPGNRLKITGVLREIPKGLGSVKLDFFLDSNHVEPTEIGWRHLEITEEDEKKVKEFAKDPAIYEKLVDSIAPSLYGLREIKESIILQMFGGVPRILKDGVHFRGDIHLLLIGDPSSGKSQLLKLVPTIVPRGKYVSGKGVTGAGLCMAFDTLVASAHGEMKKIGEIVEEALKNSSQKIESGFVGENGDFEVVCLDSKNLKMKKMKVSKFFKLKPTGDLIEIITRTGRKIKLTQENPVMVIENGEIAWKQIKDVKEGERIALARYLPINEIGANMQPEFARFSGMVAGDGDVGNREIRFHNGSERYLDSFSDICRRLGYKPRKYYPKNRVACVRVASKSLCDKIDSMGIPRGVKSDKIVIPREIMMSNELLSGFLSGIFDCDGSVVSKGNGSYLEYSTTSRMIAQQIQTSLLRFGILSKVRERKPSKKGFAGKKLKYEIIIRGRENLEAFKKYIGFTLEKAEKLDRILFRDIRPNTNVDLIPNLGQRIESTRKELGIKIKNDKELYLLRHYEHGRRDFSRAQLLRFATALNKRRKSPYFDLLKTLSHSDIFWDRVISKKDVQEEFVYDLTVDGEHNFVANDFILHNTATVVKDEMFMGGWVLEAGALVMTNGGLLAIDEFEKMSQDDQVAMHEALEQGTISIAKASIVATLPAQTSVLAGGNPKFSRFDPYLPIAKQIIIPDTLLTRFDLKFALRDLPDNEMDKKIVDHVLRAREHDYEASRPVIDPNFIRKYVAYCKKNCTPVLTPEAGKSLKKFYVNMRKRAEERGGMGGPIPITLRQFEALIRLSEASARIQLSNEVRKEDTQRAIKLMRFSLEQLGLDTKTGEIDIDKAEGAATTSSDRSRIRTVLDAIAELSEKSKEVPIAEIHRLAKRDGIENEYEVDEIIEKLKRDGLLFEPSPKYVQRV